MLASELTDTWKDLQPGVEEVAEVAFALAAKRSLDQALVWAAGGNWPYHALPHAATVLCMRTNRPAIVVGLEEDLARGVGKSVSGIDMGTVIEHCALEGLVSTCKARRITVDIEMPVQNVTRVMKRVELLLRRQGAHLRDRHALSLDGLLHSQALSVDLVEAIERAGPFGMKSPRPRFAMPWVRIKGRKLLSNRHLALTLTDERRRDTRAFMADATNSPVGKFLLSCRRHHVHVAGTPTLYCQRGKNVPTFRIEDVASAR